MLIPAGKVVPLAQANRWVIPDIHGCANTLLALLQQLNVKSTDQLFFLGDYVGKGKNSPKVIEILDSIQASVFKLMGNHDFYVYQHLTAPSEETELRLVKNNSSVFLNLSESQRKHYIHWFESLSYFIIHGDCLMVHAGFDFTLQNPFLGFEAMLTTKDFYYDALKAQNKVLIHGHVPQPIDVIRLRVESRKRAFCLDNGCVYAGEKEGQGNLLALNLNEYQLVIQPNID